MAEYKFSVHVGVLAVLLFFLCSCSTVWNSYTNVQDLCAGKIVIKEKVDLRGRTINLPEGCTLVFKKRGLISNGSIIGADTHIEYNGTCFDNVTIQGTWKVPVIRSDMFLTYEKTSLTNLFKLQNALIKNKIYVAPGTYFVNSNDQRAGLPLTSNTTLYLDGDIVLEEQTNSQFYNGYYIISINRAENVSVMGNGTIEGDLGRSNFKPGYGHGICVYESKNVSIDGLSIKNVQGDGMALSTGNANVLVNNVTIDHYYRNGISVIDGHDIRINNVSVMNGGLSDPYAAIDVEPNEGGNIYNVHINNITIENCVVGISGYVPQNAQVTKVRYNGVKMNGVSKCCFYTSNFTDLEIHNALVENVGDDAEIMRFLGNHALLLSHVKIDAGNNKAKYPFYLSNDDLRIENCSFNCPQLFSWHLSDAQFINTSFKFDSFIWTAANISNNNITFDNCTFDGPLFMRPNNVSFTKSIFKNSHTNHKYLVRFEDSMSQVDDYSGVYMNDNTFETSRNVTESSAVDCTIKKSIITKSNYK